MILSMTGFGSGELILDNSHFNFYIKSLNSKNLDISLKVPSSTMSAFRFCYENKGVIATV